MRQELEARPRIFSSAAMAALFGPSERWGWELEAPVEWAPSPLRSSPPAPRPGEEYSVTYDEWRRAVERDEHERAVRASTPPAWIARQPSENYTVAAVFGGTRSGWEALLTTFGGSVLGAGLHLTVVNLSERPAAASLKVLARQAGFRVRGDTVSPRKTSFDLFSFVGDNAIVDFLVDVIHHEETDSTASARDDRELLRSVVEALGNRVSIKRLQAGLKVILREADPPRGDGLLTLDEYKRLAALVGDERRSHTDIVARAARLGDSMRDFGALEDAAAMAPSERHRRSEDLRIIEVLRSANRLDFELCQQILLHALYRRLKRRDDGMARSDIVVILGADALDRRMIDSFAEIADQRRMRVIALFAHLRDDAVDAMGAARTCSVFMRLTDHREATEAARYIGSEHKFVLSQTTKLRSEEYEQSSAWSSGRETGESSSMGPMFAYTVGRSSGQSKGVSSTTSSGVHLSASQTDQRVFEEIVQPHIIQGLPETGLMFANLTTREPLFADCDPTLVLNADSVTPRELR